MKKFITLLSIITLTFITIISFTLKPPQWKNNNNNPNIIQQIYKLDSLILITRYDTSSKQFIIDFQINNKFPNLNPYYASLSFVNNHNHFIYLNPLQTLSGIKLSKIDSYSLLSNIKYKDSINLTLITYPNNKQYNFTIYKSNIIDMLSHH